MLDSTSPLKVSSISNSVYTALKRDIMSSKLPPGERLLVLDIAGKFQVSQAPVREALERLKQEGLIIGQPNKGSIVSNVTAKEIRDLFALREIIEGYAAKQTMTHLTDEDYKYLHWVLKQMGEAIKENDILKILEKDMEFHGFFYRRCDNAAIMELWGHMKTKIMRFMAISNRHYSTEKLVEWHLRLIHALQSGDQKRVESEFVEHMHSYKMIHID